MPKAGALDDETAAFRTLTRVIDPWRSPDESWEAAERSLPSSSDWPALLAHARRHRVMPLLARNVLAMPPEALRVPADIRETLERTARTAAMSELAMLGEIRRLKALFEAAGIAFLLVKGLALSQRCFGGPGWRTNNDIDLLIPRQDMPGAHAIMRANDYDRVEPRAELAQDEIDRDLDRRKDWVYRKRKTGIVVEVHHRLFDNARLCDPSVIERGEPTVLFGQVEVATLSPDDELPYLALHGAMHAWSRLKWLVDFAILLRRRSPAEIDAMLQAARGGPAACALHQGIALCWRLFAPGTAEPRAHRPWRTAVLSAAAMQAISGEGSQELEGTRFGTTIKNASHYLLWNNPAYLAAEFGYDITEVSQEQINPDSKLPLWLQRPAAWMGRRL